MAWPLCDAYAHHRQNAYMHATNREWVVFVFAVSMHVVWIGSTTQKGITDPDAVRGITGRVWVVYVVTCPKAFRQRLHSTKRMLCLLHRSPTSFV